MDEMIVAIGVPEDVSIARQVLNHGRRLASRLGARWVALRVHSRSVDPRCDQSTLRLRQLVAMHGGDLLCTAAADEVEGLVEMAAREHADALVIGSSRRFRLIRRWMPGFTEKVLRSERKFDVIVAQRERLRD